MDQAIEYITAHHWCLDASIARPSHALMIQHGDRPVTRVSIPRFPFVIGRGRPASLVLHDRTIARAHCHLDREGDAAVLRDLGSSRGTFVNGVRVEGSVPLADGHLIRIGDHTLRYLCRGRTEQEEEAAARERQEASAYVAAILPPRLTHGSVLTDYVFQPSNELSGDAFGYEWLDDRWFTVFMLDVAGHGTAAALHAVSAANAIRQRMLPDVDFRDPTSVLGALNRILPMERHDERFFTIWYGAYDSRTRLLRFASGGHHPAYLVRAATGGDEDAAGSSQGLLHIRERLAHRVIVPLVTRNPAIGITADRCFESQSMSIPHGAALHLFSDGAFEHHSRSVDLQDYVALLPQACDADGPRRLYAAVVERAGQPEDDFSTLLVRFV